MPGWLSDLPDLGGSGRKPMGTMNQKLSSDLDLLLVAGKRTKAIAGRTRGAHKSERQNKNCTFPYECLRSSKFPIETKSNDSSFAKVSAKNQSDQPFALDLNPTIGPNDYGKLPEFDLNRKDYLKKRGVMGNAPTHEIQARGVLPMKKTVVSISNEEDPLLSLVNVRSDDVPAHVKTSPTKVDIPTALCRVTAKIDPEPPAELPPQPMKKLKPLPLVKPMNFTYGNKLGPIKSGPSKVPDVQSGIPYPPIAKNLKVQGYRENGTSLEAPRQGASVFQSSLSPSSFQKTPVFEEDAESPPAKSIQEESCDTDDDMAAYSEGLPEDEAELLYLEDDEENKGSASKCRKMDEKNPLCKVPVPPRSPLPALDLPTLPKLPAFALRREEDPLLAAHYTSKSAPPLERKTMLESLDSDLPCQQNLARDPFPKPIKEALNPSSAEDQLSECSVPKATLNVGSANRMILKDITEPKAMESRRYELDGYHSAVSYSLSSSEVKEEEALNQSTPFPLQNSQPSTSCWNIQEESKTNDDINKSQVQKPEYVQDFTCSPPESESMQVVPKVVTQPKKSGIVDQEESGTDEVGFYNLACSILTCTEAIPKSTITDQKEILNALLKEVADEGQNDKVAACDAEDESEDHFYVRYETSEYDETESLFVPNKLNTCGKNGVKYENYELEDNYDMEEDISAKFYNSDQDAASISSLEESEMEDDENRVPRLHAVSFAREEFEDKDLADSKNETLKIPNTSIVELDNISSSTQSADADENNQIIQNVAEASDIHGEKACIKSSSLLPGCNTEGSVLDFQAEETLLNATVSQTTDIDENGYKESENAIPLRLTIGKLLTSLCDGEKGSESDSSSLYSDSETPRYLEAFCRQNAEIQAWVKPSLLTVRAYQFIMHSRVGLASNGGLKAKMRANNIAKISGPLKTACLAV